MEETKCYGEQCPVRNDCNRFMSFEEAGRPIYRGRKFMFFVANPRLIDMKLGKPIKGACNAFIPKAKR